ncbi:pro-sigmaK processing inhibitor BofA family protein [Desulfovirgula thermocuniculi]|uniref:pro-sigmaK processing inhibitor BofA family protein n=1 Tax=Desulfovirgula thermocuniculi TaxID=348842 RepID=UPI0004189E67|nr:pro-sigmaK processing inhibitor BofA family protein [Desulfovirgula thermocuniculi]
MDLKLVFWGLVGILGLVLVGNALWTPLKFLLRAAFCLATGGILLAGVNLLFGHWGLHIALNPFTLLLAGVLQVPGVILLALLRCFFV